jgi:hypothetical protein
MSVAGEEAVTGGRAVRGRGLCAGLALFAALVSSAHPRAAIAQNAASIQIAVVVVDLPVERVLPAHLEGEVLRAGHSSPDIAWRGRMRRVELGGGLAAAVTEEIGRAWLRVRLEYIAN